MQFLCISCVVLSSSSFFFLFDDINPCFHINMLNVCQVESLLDSVKWDGKGLVVAIAQNVDTGAILMQGFANRDAVVTTLSSRKATFYSRSRSTLWTKGETSNNFINVHDVFLDCDRDSVSSFFLFNYQSFLFLFCFVVSHGMLFAFFSWQPFLR